MDCQRALDILDCVRPLAAEGSADEMEAANEHLAHCPNCAAIVRGRRQFDRRIGRLMRAVEVPAGGRERLLAVLAGAPESPDHGSSSQNGSADPSVAVGTAAVPTGNTQSVRRAGPSTLFSRRRILKVAAPAAACALLAATAFFGVVWILTPRLSVDDVCRRLAKIDLGELQSLPEFRGQGGEGPPTEPGWQSVDWCCSRVAKQVSATPGGTPFPVYGFQLRHDRRKVVVLLAAIPRNRIANPPAAGSLAAASAIGYVTAKNGDGEAVTVAWTSGDLIYVCVVQGGADSLELLQRRVETPPA